MTHTYTITGMTCDGCVAKVTHLLKQLPAITDVTVNLEAGQANITMKKHVAIDELRQALAAYPKYQISEVETHTSGVNKFGDKGNIFGNDAVTSGIEEDKSWLQTYKPIVLIALYITVIASIVTLNTGSFNEMLFMRVFMAGFFLIFSFPKILH